MISFANRYHHDIYLTSLLYQFGQLIFCSFDNSLSNTPDDNFKEDIVDKLQVMLKAILNDIDISNIRVMFYSNIAKFHISIIPIRWYKDDILMKLNSSILENSPVLTVVESSDIAMLHTITCSTGCIFNYIPESSDVSLSAQHLPDTVEQIMDLSLNIYRVHA
ncbi:hypothetical protein GLOIN_2v1873403 [Rhizophagus irregularis DAOM 181602=DAOM 197198]|nr:hypothetical protein GLOIN_2v1873403 [Rhizophagus irregularis DAOM 181602=DAOM 197198]GET61612.1 hypothetical protein GLOIN_2v1873403 [Rhizophagus irregularis DAOM 181602=DAOM 197198]